MATRNTSTFASTDRRKKRITYGKSAKTTARFHEYNSGPNESRALDNKVQRFVPHSEPPLQIRDNPEKLLSQIRIPAPSRDIFDFPSDEENPLPTPASSKAGKATASRISRTDNDFRDDMEQSGSLAQRSRPMTNFQGTKKTVNDHRPLSNMKVEVKKQDYSKTLSQDFIKTDPQGLPDKLLQQPSLSAVRTLPYRRLGPLDIVKTTSPILGANKAKRPIVHAPAKVDQDALRKTHLEKNIFDVPSSDEDASGSSTRKPRSSLLSRTNAVTSSSIFPSPNTISGFDNMTISQKRKRGLSNVSPTKVKRTEPRTQIQIMPTQHQSAHRRKVSVVIPKNESPKGVKKGVPISGPAGSAADKSRQTRIRNGTETSTQSSPLAKAVSSPAQLNDMLPTDFWDKLPSNQSTFNTSPAAGEPKCELKERLRTPPRKPTAPGSITPRQHLLFRNLLGDDDNRALRTHTMTRLSSNSSVSRVATLIKSTSDVARSTYSRDNRLIDILKRTAPSSDQGDESDDEIGNPKADGDTHRHVSAHIISSCRESPAQKTVPAEHKDTLSPDDSQTSLASQTAARSQLGSRVTYGQQRSYLEDKENNLEDALMLVMDDDSGLAATAERDGLSESEDDTAQVRGIHELRRQGRHHRFQAEAQAAIDDIAGRGHLNESQRRSAMVEMATHMADPTYMEKLLESALTASFLRAISFSSEIIFDFAAAAAVLFILETQPAYAVLEHIRKSGLFLTLTKLLTSDFATLDVQKIAKDRKTNMARSTQETISEFRVKILASSVWGTAPPDILPPQLLALKVFELLITSLRKAGDMQPILDEPMVNRLLDIIHGSTQRFQGASASAQDRSILQIFFSIFESLTLATGGSSIWSTKTLERLRDVMSTSLQASNAMPLRLLIRLCMNLTNNEPENCQLFATPLFVLPLLRSICHNLKLMRDQPDVARRDIVMEDLVLSLGAMINLGEFSDQARRSVLQGGDELMDELVTLFLEGSERADRADSMEESQSGVTIGYLTVVLGSLALNDKVRACICSRLPGRQMGILIQKIREFVLYNQRVDQLSEQFEGEEGQDTMRNFTSRLMHVAERLERAGS